MKGKFFPLARPGKVQDRMGTGKPLCRHQLPNGMGKKRQHQSVTTAFLRLPLVPTTLFLDDNVPLFDIQIEIVDANM